MRLIALTAVSAMALAAAACAPRVDYAHRTTLDCPDRQGELQRTGVAADRRSCTYSAGGGTEVTLQLTPVSGDPRATLGAIEASLTGPAAPGAPTKAAQSAAVAEGAAASATTGAAVASSDAARAAQEAGQDAGQASAKDEDWTSDEPKDATRHHGHGGDEDAHIHLPGIHIDAQGDSARVNIAGVQIDADSDEATVHVVRDVRLRGEAFSRQRNGMRAIFIAKRDNLPDGYRFVGYQAAGPKTGPLTVAMVKSREEINDGNRLYHDIERLVRRNAGA